MSLELVKTDDTEQRLEAAQKRDRALEHTFWDEFQVGKPGAVAVKGVKNLSIPQIQKINALLNSKGSFLIEHTSVPTPERAGVPIFEVATIQRKVYYATKLKLLRSSMGSLNICADGPHNGQPEQYLIVQDRQDVNAFFRVSGRDKDDLEREALERDGYRPGSVVGIMDMHAMWRFSDVQVTLTKNRLVIKYIGGYFPGEMVITFNPKGAFTSVGAEEQRYAGTYTFVPTTDVKALTKLEKAHKGHKSQMRRSSKRDYLRY